MSKIWLDFVEDLNKHFPLINAAGSFPHLGSALDDGVNDILRESLADAVNINPLYVEDLLANCIDRISNCLLLREKANEIEIRAVSDAINYQLQTVALDTAKSVADTLKPIVSKMGQFSTGIRNKGNGDAEFVGDEPIWDIVQSFQDKLSETQRQGLDALRTKALTAGNGSNYVERFTFIKQLFDLSIVEAYRRALVCSKALKSIYGISFEVPKIKPTGYLNELSMWAQRSSNALDVEQDQRYFGEVAFAIAGLDGILKENELITKEKFNAQITAGSIDFSLVSSNFEKALMKDVLLRSVRLQIRAKDDARVRLWPARIRLPGSPNSPSETFTCIAPSLYQNPVDNESIIHGVHNINPIGSWSITLPERSLTGETTGAAEIQNIYLFLRVSYRRL